MSYPSSGPVAPAQQAVDLQRLALEQRLRARLCWLYWIGGLSAINSVISLSGGGIRFIFGLGVTQLIDAIAQMVAKEAGPRAAHVASAVGLGTSLACAGVFLLLGYLAIRRSLIAAILGFLLYVGDGLLMVPLQDWLGAGFHVFVLAMLWGGIQTILALRRAEAAAYPAMASYATAPYPAPDAAWPQQQPQAWPQQQQQAWPQQQQVWPQQTPPPPSPSEQSPPR